MQVTLEREKETKHKVRFIEPGDTPRIGTVYVPRSTLAKLGDPQQLTVTLAPGQVPSALAA